MGKTRTRALDRHGQEVEILTERHDIYLRAGEDGWAVDVFSTRVRDNDKAHMESAGPFAHIEEALAHIAGWGDVE